ncbi:MAG: hypothetical protein R3E53_07550 [Myxococcota bacterium]
MLECDGELIASVSLGLPAAGGICVRVEVVGAFGPWADAVWERARN